MSLSDQQSLGLSQEQLILHTDLYMSYICIIYLFYIYIDIYMCAQNSNATLARRELGASGIGQRQRGGCNLLQKGWWGWVVLGNHFFVTCLDSQQIVVQFSHCNNVMKLLEKIPNTCN